jgi:glutamine amidotransferase
MCRWLAYIGTPLLLEELLYKPQHSLIDQSLHAQLGATTTNGDGTGVGWYGEHLSPGLYRSIAPAWGDLNLREIAGQIRARAFLAHVRASTGSAVQQTNCHPFRHKHWLWMHNGQISHFQKIKRELMLAIDPELYPEISGSTDSEVFFFLAITFGLSHDPPQAVERAVGFIEQVGRAAGIEQPIRLTVAMSNGHKVWGFRYSSNGRSASLYHTVEVATLKEQYPDNPILHDLSAESRLVVSEPFGGLAGAWLEVPEASYAVVGQGEDEIVKFRPRAP